MSYRCSLTHFKEIRFQRFFRHFAGRSKDFCSIKPADPGIAVSGTGRQDSHGKNQSFMCVDLACCTKHGFFCQHSCSADPGKKVLEIPFPEISFKKHFCQIGSDGIGASFKSIHVHIMVSTIVMTIYKSWLWSGINFSKDRTFDTLFYFCRGKHCRIRSCIHEITPPYQSYVLWKNRNYACST